MIDAIAGLTSIREPGCQSSTIVLIVKVVILDATRPVLRQHNHLVGPHLTHLLAHSMDDHSDPCKAESVLDL